jgi:carbamoyl-phosphate synthase / aspartate carbamoyltransferase
VYTIRSELGTLNGRTVTLLGDLKNGRTVHSLVTLLCLYSVRLNFVAPPSLRMPASVTQAARKAGVFVRECEAIDEVLSETDVLYVTRVQKERFENEYDWARVKDAYRVDHALLSRAKEDMIVMHPLPRVNEIDPEVDFDSRRAVYFRQMRYGLFVSAVLGMLESRCLTKMCRFAWPFSRQLLDKPRQHLTFLSDVLLLYSYVQPQC